MVLAHISSVSLSFLPSIKLCKSQEKKTTIRRKPHTISAASQFVLD